MTTRTLRTIWIVAVLACALNAAGGVLADTGKKIRILSFEERVAAQRAIEEVYWRHRIWPEENPGPKPSFEKAVPDSVIRAKVEDSLRKSSALEAIWTRRITPEQLQAEMDRMARRSRRPQVLLELQTVLDDPLLIAECLARPVLADRLLRTWHAQDERFTGADRGFEEWWSRNSRQFAPTVVLQEATYVPASPEAVGCTDDTWSPTHWEPPDPVSHASAVWTGSEMIVWGGKDPAVAVNRGYRYNPATDTWTPMTTIGAPPARTEHTMVWTGSVAIVWGGEITPGGPYTNTGARYDPVGDAWTSTSTGTNLPSARKDHTAVWTGTEMIVWGGSPFEFNDGGRYNPTTDTWTPTSTGANVPTGRYEHTAVWTGSRMIVWGGASPETNTGALYDPGTDTWIPMTTTNAPSERIKHVAVWTGSSMIVWGGSLSGVTLNTGGRYDPVTNSWTATAPTGAPPRRHEHTAVWTGSEMIVWGGSSFGVALDTGGRYSPATDTWVATSTGAGHPVARWDHVAVWTGTEMIVWGGIGTGSDNRALSSGARYAPASDSWIPTSSATTVPVARKDHPAVWTGAEMIVYGGVAPSVELANGARYDPATDAWTAIPPDKTARTAVWTGLEVITWGPAGGGRYRPVANAWIPLPGGGPTVRIEHSAVWTGTQMIVWGGIYPAGGGAPANTGSRYDPIQNTWTPTGTGANVPSPRSKHSAVWTGTLMIVWGGSTDLNTGGRYDPVTNSWTPTSTGAGCPSPRSRSRAVWTGSEMIVWGGLGSGGGPNTGGRYDPTTDSWTPTSTGANVPIPRTGHSMIWTGTEMIVWGGDVGVANRRENSGARYHPATDTWTPTSMGIGLPLGRAYHSAVRTDSEMIVWGGEPMTSTGGRYCTAPCTPQTWYQDADDDGYGSDTAAQSSCTRPAGYTWARGDCDDANPAVRPYQTELCNGFDDDCDTTVDEGFNADGDPYTTCAGDCNDASATIYPGAPQLCDGINNDCSDPSWPTVPANEANADGDGFRICAGDCNDASASTYPGAPQLCNGVNDNCSDPSWPAVPANEADADADGYRICQNDCNDANANVNPGRAETCNGIDDNCAGGIDEDASGVDSDADGVHNVCDNCRFAVNADQLDSDADQVGNACDNCISVANTDQADPDADGRGTSCDNCPTSANSNQDDADADQRGDVCDNCLFDYNPNQSDFDADNQGDLCDLNDGLIYVFNTGDDNYIEWQAESGPTSFNVYEGDLSVLRSTGVYTQVAGSNPLAERHCGVTDAFVEDFGFPPPGQTAFHLVTGITGGVEGSLGQKSDGTDRPNDNPCP